MSAGWRLVDLGPRILRVETAATLSLLLAYASTWCFATDAARYNRESNVAYYPHQVMR